jgi:Uncharacterized conserved protein
MEDRWSDRDAEAAVERYTKQGVGYDLALRTYSTRLLGADPRLVIHGGGNTSVKTQAQDVTGEMVNVLCVKGSGWDMATIEPAGLPAVRLEPLQRAASLDALTDEAMVNLQRVNLLDASAPNPSVETLLHAFLPYKYIDHTHANAILALTDQPQGEQLCRELFGKRMAMVPYIMPGFQLAKQALAVHHQHPGAEGMILLKHGIFTFGDTAKQAYERMIEMVALAEARIAEVTRVSVAGVQLPKGLGRYRPKSLAPIRLPSALIPVAQLAPILRGLLATPRGPEGWKRCVLDFRGGPNVEDFVNGHEVARYSQRGTVTPDHVIRTKRLPLVLPPPEARDLAAFTDRARAAVEAYATEYRRYFDRNNERVDRIKKPLDPMPRVVLVPGLGLFGAGASKQEARVAADLAQTNIEVITCAEAMSTYESLSEADAFDMEYWSLEQAKLGKGVEKPFAGQVVVVTGGGSGIGAATARAFRNGGAEVAVLDRSEAAAGKLAHDVGGISIVCDVTDQAQVASAFDRVVEAFGGVDIVVSNAGAAWQGRIGDVADTVLRQSFELNFWAHQSVAKRAVSIMRAQATGGCLLFNASKQALNPGPDFGPYGLPKAATLALMRQYALDHGCDHIRANAVNADRIRSGLLTPSMIAERAKARGVSEEKYMAGNLLGLEVSAEDVARAFVHLALSATTTAAVLTVDGGNIAASVR